jgi:hypothetical protein
MLGVVDLATRGVRKTTQKQRDAFAARFGLPQAQQNAAAAATPLPPLAAAEAAQSGVAPHAQMGERGGAESREQGVPTHQPTSRVHPAIAL